MLRSTWSALNARWFGLKSSPLIALGSSKMGSDRMYPVDETLPDPAPPPEQTDRERRNAIIKHYLMRVILVVSVFLLVVLLIATAALMLFVSKKSETKAPPASAVLSKRQPNSSIIVVGGIDRSGKVLDSIILYDPINPSETQLLGTKMLSPRRNHAAAVVNGQIVVVGGQDAEGYLLSSVEILTAETKVWVPGQSMVSAREKAAVAVLDSTLYLCGGSMVGQHKVSLCQSLSPNLKTWQSSAPLLEHLHPISGASAPEYFYMSGLGVNARLERFNPSKNSFETLSDSVPVGRKSMSMAYIQNHLLICGFKTDKPAAACFSYNLETKEWRETGRMQIEKAHFALVTFGEDVYALGGQAAGVETSSVESYDLFNNQWKIESSLPVPVSFCAAVLY